VINISNHLLVQARGDGGPKGDGRPREDQGPRGDGGRAAPRERGGLREFVPPRLYRLVGFVPLGLHRLAYFLRRLGDRWFAVNDTEACWWGWQTSKTAGGLGRRYRNVRFDTLAACARCAGAGVWADAPCGPCLGTGRMAVGEVS
jgi:hypothetical protein